MKVTVNGKITQLPAPMALLEFLASKEIRTQYLAIAYNGEVLGRDQFSSITLRDGDDLELVRPVGGGA